MPSPTNEIICPGCDAGLEERVAIYTDEDGREVDYVAFVCPNALCASDFF